MKQTHYRVGIVGHRYLGGNESENYVRFCCFKLLSEFKARHTNLTAVSAASKGADTIFSDIAICLEVKLNTIIPFKEFSEDFDTELSLERSNALRERSAKSECANFSKRSISAYKKSMEWVVIKSHSLIAVWDGHSNGSPGGTGRAIELAMSIGKPMFHINPFNRTLDYFDAINKNRNNSVRLDIDEIGRYI